MFAYFLGNKNKPQYIETILGALQLQNCQYAQIFIDNGYETKESLVDLTIEDLTKLGIKAGHRKILYEKFQEQDVNKKSKKDIELILEELGLEEYNYGRILIEKGYDTNDALLSLTKERLLQIGIREGHAPILHCRIEKIKSQVQEKQLAKQYISSTPKITVEIILVGPVCVGKSTLIERYFQDKHVEIPATRKMEETLWNIPMFDKTIRVIVRDAPGQDNLWDAIEDEKFENAIGGICVCSCERKDSIFELEHKYLTTFKTFNPFSQVSIICNKIDLENDRKDEVVYIQQQVKRINKNNENAFKVYYTSTKDGASVQNAFDSIIQDAVLNQLKRRQIKSENDDQKE